MLVTQTDSRSSDYAEAAVRIGERTRLFSDCDGSVTNTAVIGKLDDARAVQLQGWKDETTSIIHERACVNDNVNHDPQHPSADGDIVSIGDLRVYEEVQEGDVAAGPIAAAEASLSSLNHKI